MTGSINARHLFQKSGFKELGVENVDLENHGGEHGKEKRVWLMVREPQP